MAVTIKQDVPVGGGLGNKKVMVATLDGTYVTGGFMLFKEAPLFAIATNGYAVSFNASTGKTQLIAGAGTSGGTVTIATQTIEGVEFTNAAAITGTVEDTTATIAIGDADVSGNVVIPELTGTISGQSTVAATEIGNGTSVAGVAIFAIF